MKNSNRPALVVMARDDSKEIEILKNIFGIHFVDGREDPYIPLSGHAMGLWDQWSEESKNTVKRCVARGWLTMKWGQPTEDGFQLWLLCHRNFLKDYEMSDEQMRLRYHKEFQSMPTLILTEEGKKTLKDVLGDDNNHLRRRREYAAPQD